ncbi:hypothetical protein EDB81DRAFT_872496 [Dactylonectria macrodidyma]|uniref:Uncharacterized protein n=1 Tax=Dactylonectria macrodidyma TaxID=307937 RepID=A0A9P9IL52_9HYPO|nr:hypothetical protein EDB81DRAFT_872496 [Dactylonectria macrodidyma]
MASQKPPADRKSFRVAIICALPREADAVNLLFDQFWDEDRDPYGRADGDTNIYITGRIGDHHIVLAVLPSMGTNSAAAATASLRSSYTDLKLAILVGICGGVPRIANYDAFLGDVVVSKSIIQYDYGRQYHGHFAVKSTVEDSLGRANRDIRSLLAVFETELMRERLQAEASRHLKHLQEAAKKGRRRANYQYPGMNEDKLYPPTYMHRHRKWCGRFEELVQGGAFSPEIFIGRIGSGNTVMKSGEDRDQIAARHDLIAFEMEGAGACDEVPCIVVKGICDYADSHKNKAWQDFAAATAASVAKAILGRYAVHDGDRDEVHEPCYYIPFPRNIRFTGRATIINALEDKFFGQEQSQKTALVGLGGIGKTQIALHFAYQIKKKRPDYSIFWVPILSNESAERAFVEIAKKLGLHRSSEDEDVKDLVCQHLSSDKADKWLLIVDNADDQELILGSADKPGLEEYLPQSENGIILLTTRSRLVAVEFAQSDVIDVEQMNEEEAADLLKNSLIQKQLFQDEALIQTYLDLLRGAEDDIARVLGREFRDNTRYRGSRNAIGTTWMVSFDQIQKSNQLAVDLLSFMSHIEPKAIPKSILPDAEPDELEWAIGMLCSYSFLVRRREGDVFDMHSLVHAATRGWLGKQDPDGQVASDVICHLAARFPAKNDAHHDLRREYLPHAMQLLSRNYKNKTDQTYHLFEKVGDSFEADRRFKEAIKCFEEVCWWRQGLHPETDGVRLASEHALASAYLDDRRIEDAIEILEHVVVIRKETLDEKDHSRLASEHALASAYLNDRRIEDAIEILEHVVAVQKEILDEKDHSRLVSEHELARAYLDDRRIEDAIEIFEHVVAVQKETLDEKDHSRLVSEHELARAYLNDRRIKDAIEILKRVVAIEAKILAEDDPSRQLSRDLLQDCYESLEKTRGESDVSGSDR